MSLKQQLEMSILQSGMSGQRPAVTRLPLEEADRELEMALAVRQPDYNIDEDGRALSERIWRFRGPVGLHKDDAWRGFLVYGYVFNWTQHWLVVPGAEKVVPLYRNSVYQLDPLTIHGTVAETYADPLIVYTEQLLPRDAAKITYQEFADRALEHGRKLVKSPQPRFED